MFERSEFTQALQVAIFFDTERLNFCRSRDFLVTFWSFQKVT